MDDEAIAIELRLLRIFRIDDIELEFNRENFADVDLLLWNVQAKKGITIKRGGIGLRDGQRHGLRGVGSAIDGDADRRQRVLSWLRRGDGVVENVLDGSLAVDARDISG